MDVTINADQQLLTDTAASVADALATTSTAALPPDQSSSTGAWETLCETGFVAMRLTEALGGGGATSFDTALVIEQLARRLSIAPMIGQGVLAPELLASAGADRDRLHRIVDGTHRVTVAVDPTMCGLARAGCAAFVWDALGAHEALALDDADRVVSIDLSTTRFADHAPTSADLTRLVHVVPSGSPAQPVGAALDAAALARFEALALAMLAADLVGVMQGAVDAAAGYVRERVQFGVPVGSFQAVQHLAADAKVMLEGARSSMWHAAWAVDALDPSDALLAARQAKSYCSRAGRNVVEIHVQLYGGIAITWEELAHVRVRRALFDRASFGDENYQDDAIALARVGAAR